jgi:hypothetical protein
VIVLQHFHGRGSINAVHAARSREIGDQGATVTDTHTSLTDNGRVIGWRSTEDGAELIEYTPLEGLRLRLAHQLGTAADHARRAADAEALAPRWSHRADQARRERAFEGEWRAKAKATEALIAAAQSAGRAA